MLATITAISSIATPIILLILAAIGWSVRYSIERRAKLEENLRVDRIKIYNEIIEPYIVLHSSSAAWKDDSEKDQAFSSKFHSIDHRRNSFLLAMIGSDDVVRSYNAIMQHLFKSPNRSDDKNVSSVSEAVRNIYLLGEFLLQIRKSLGNEKTELNGWDMISWFIKDIDKMQDIHKKYEKLS